MAEAARKAYTDAVTCLQSLPARTPSDLVPGAKSRYDDFVAAHMNQTLTIHYTVGFDGIDYPQSSSILMIA